jgi:hypothetical protein
MHRFCRGFRRRHWLTLRERDRKHMDGLLETFGLLLAEVREIEGGRLGVASRSANETAAARSVRWHGCGQRGGYLLDRRRVNSTAATPSRPEPAFSWWQGMLRSSAQ